MLMKIENMRFFVFLIVTALHSTVFGQQMTTVENTKTSMDEDYPIHDPSGFAPITNRVNLGVVENAGQRILDCGARRSGGASGSIGNRSQHLQATPQHGQFS
jgi:hypothetical protein